MYTDQQCFLFGSALGIIESWLSDKYNTRGIVVVVNAVLQIVGVALLGYAKSNGVRYFGAFILTGGCNANVSASLTYQSNNITGQWRRAFGSALIVGAGGVGGVVGGLVFREQDAPEYRQVSQCYHSCACWEECLLIRVDRVCGRALLRLG